MGFVNWMASSIVDWWWVTVTQFPYYIVKCPIAENLQLHYTHAADKRIVISILRRLHWKR